MQSPLASRAQAFATALAVAVVAAGCVAPGAKISPLDASPAGTTPAERSETTSDDSGDATSDDPLGGFEPAPIAWATCPRTTTKKCGDLLVPVDWSDTDGPTVAIAVAMAPAGGERIGSLVLNPGGPGASGRNLAFHPPVSDAVEQRFDVVGFDPRGVGESDGLTCGSNADEFWSHDSSPDDDVEKARLDASAEEFAKECAGDDGALIANMGTDSVARDLEALRRALGDEPLNYLGFSYGTLIGLRYLDLFGDHVRTIVLDGVVDPTQPLTEWLAGQTRGLDTSVSDIFAACESSSRCPLDDPATAYDELAARLESDPIESSVPSGPAQLGPSELATAAIMATYAPSLRTPLLEAIDDALDGDPAPMLRLTAQYYSFGGFASYVSVVCSDSQHPVGADEWRTFAEELASISPRFGASVANELLPCAFWAFEPRPVTGAVVADGAPPVLVLGNRGDAATPYANSVAVADSLSGGVLISYDGSGHTSYGESRCVDEVVDTYLIEGDTPSADPDC